GCDDRLQNVDNSLGVGCQRPPNLERLLDRHPETASDRQYRDGSAEVDVEFGASVAREPVDEHVYGFGDPIVDPPFSVRRQERWLDQSAITLVLIAGHRQHAVGETEGTAVEVDGHR